MKKYILNTLLCTALFCATTLRADEAPVIETPPPDQEALPPEHPPREVGRASADGVDMGKQRNLGNIAIALLAITVAVTAIILVSKNQGKHA